MTNEKAIEVLKAAYDPTRNSVRLSLKLLEAISKGIEALDKQTSHLPLESYDGYYNGTPCYEFRCPCCEHFFDDDETPDYCEDCGQAIDWSFLEAREAER